MTKKKQIPLKWGRGNLMALAAFRYCLGRSTYIVSDCADWIIENWDEFDSSLRKIILFEIKEEMDNLRGNPMMRCDQYQWKRILELKNE
jgi:hypothetical protein